MGPDGPVLDFGGSIDRRDRKLTPMQELRDRWRAGFLRDETEKFRTLERFKAAFFVPNQ